MEHIKERTFLQFRYSLSLALLCILVTHLFFLWHGSPALFDPLVNAAQGVMDGHPHWITYQNRLLGPCVVWLISKCGCSFSFALTLFFSMGIIIEIFLLNCLLRSLGCSHQAAFLWTTLYGFLFISYQHYWFYPWDTVESILWTIFAYGVLRHKTTLYFVVLFFIALLNRESALFIPLFLILREISAILLENNELRFTSIRTIMLAALLFVFGVTWTHVIREQLLISQTMSATYVPEDFFLGNMIKLQNFYDLVYNPSAILGTLWIVGSSLLLITVIPYDSKAHRDLLFIYLCMLCGVLLFGLIFETRIYISLFPIFIFLIAQRERFSGSHTVSQY